MTIAVLSYGSPLTLTQSLQSYADFGLDQLDDERIIYFQEITDIDIGIARKFGWKWVGSRENVGIAEGYHRLLEEATGEFFLFLENDWRLIEEPKSQIEEAQRLIQEDRVDLVRFRHRKNPGHPLWTRQFEGKEEERMTHLLDSVHWTDPDPNRFWQIRKISDFTPTVNDWYWTMSPYANWTNNPHMAYTKFLRNNVVPHLGTGDLERDIQSWWEQQDFTVAQGKGLFTHDRIDR